ALSDHRERPKSGVEYPLNLQRMTSGQHQGGRSPEERIIAVIRGRVDVMVTGGGEPPAHLRASDALRIPAQCDYHISALQDSELCIYAPAPEKPPALWGV
ncbi:MAG TPA: hypothetical protein VFP94_02945, partial [Terriglobales bacterium]|nr:hypothetical protein [Terriglobales bacterium]